MFLVSSSSDFIEFLEPGTIEAVEVVNDGEDTLELQLTQEVSIVETVVPEELELVDLGPIPDIYSNVTVHPAYTGLQIYYGPGPLPDPSEMPNTLYIVLPS
jgi:hypothetical protein